MLTGGSPPTVRAVSQTSAFHCPLPYSEQVQPDGGFWLQLVPQELGLPWQTPDAGA
jgi:hypothetical protein